jgi:adenylate cyclase
MTGPNSRKRLEDLLGHLGDHPEDWDSVADEIAESFCVEAAIVVIDLCGSSRRASEHGLLTSLVVIHQARQLLIPLAESLGGTVLQAEADNVWCLFPAVDVAVRFLDDAAPRLEAANSTLPEERAMHMSAGVGFGSIMHVEDHDFYGDEVNRAGKLGEDIAGPGEVLLTAAARAAASDDVGPFDERRVVVSGLAIEYFAVRR